VNHPDFDASHHSGWPRPSWFDGVGGGVQIVVADRNGEPIVPYVGRQAPRHRPRPKDTVLFESKVEVRTGFSMVVENEDGTGDPTTVVRHAHPDSDEGLEKDISRPNENGPRKISGDRFL
jgi:hypothetical protein